MVDRQSSYSYDELLTCAEGELFGPGNAQLPLPPMLMVHRITDISETGGEFDKGYLRAEFDITPDLWFFPCHFKGNPVMPGCLGLDGMWQLTGFYLGWLGEQGRGMALSTGEVKFKGMVTPDVKLVEYGIDFKRVMRGRLVLGIANGWLKADGETNLQRHRSEGWPCQGQNCLTHPSGRALKAGAIKIQDPPQERATS